MFHHGVAVNFDTEFPVPSDCPRSGEVTCRVVRADCEIIEAWDIWITFQLSLLLRITVRTGKRSRTFFKERRFRETVMADCRTHVDGCDVTAVACRCVLHRGRVHCNLTAKVAFTVRDRCHCGCRHRCHCRKHHHFHGCDHDFFAFSGHDRKHDHHFVAFSGHDHKHDHHLDDCRCRDRKHDHHFDFSRHDRKHDHHFDFSGHDRKHDHHFDFSGHDRKHDHDRRHRCRHCGCDHDRDFHGFSGHDHWHDDRFDGHDCRRRDHSCRRKSFQEAVIHTKHCFPYKVIQWN